MKAYQIPSIKLPTTASSSFTEEGTYTTSIQTDIKPAEIWSSQKSKMQPSHGTIATAMQCPAPTNPIKDSCTRLERHIELARSEETPGLSFHIGKLNPNGNSEWRGTNWRFESSPMHRCSTDEGFGWQMPSTSSSPWPLFGCQRSSGDQVQRIDRQAGLQNPTPKP